MKPMKLAKALAVVLAFAGAAIPTLAASSTDALARGDGGGGNGGGSSGSEGGYGADAIRSTLPPGRSPPEKRGPVVIRSTDRDPPACIDFRRGMYNYYGYPIPVPCQPYLYPYDID